MRSKQRRASRGGISARSRTRVTARTRSQPGPKRPDRRKMMPELPEVEVVRRDLEREIVGKRVKAVEADGMRSIRRHHNRKQFANRLVGKKITGIERRGKYILARLDGGDVLVIHLGMSGQLIRTKGTRETMTKHTHIVITFTQGGQLRFIDPRTFGEKFVDLNGKPGEYQLHHKVYAREGESCRRCRKEIVRQRIGGRSTFFCEACQVCPGGPGR